MTILILSQNEPLYLPASFARVCRALRSEIACVVCAPAMSTHGGTLRGFVRHLRLFGLTGTTRMASRVVLAKVKNAIQKPRPDGPFYSIAAVARAYKIPYYSIARVASQQFHAIIDSHQPDLLISISCPQIIGKKIRDRFANGCINVHGAPLPRYRGLMPAFWALRYGEPATAVTVHELGDKLDNGAILLQRPVPIEPHDTWDSLVRKTKSVGADVLIEAIDKIRNGTALRMPNRDEDASYFSFPSSADRRAFRSLGRRFF